NAQLHKRTTNFGPCPVDPPPPQFTITLSPDPIVPGKNVDVTLTGKLDVDVPADSEDIMQFPFLDETFVPIVDPFTVGLCNATGIKCPIQTGTEISTTVSVPVPAASDITVGTTFVVAIIDETEDFI
ncbi:6819_t:CDS:1, partial [Scutellospora calospora]